MAGLGIIGIALEPLWMRNIYNRFMARRYANMDGFRNSRELLS
jgi:gamma-glutamylcysteine synthetase